jgi:hypothetical protein
VPPGVFGLHPLKPGIYLSEPEPKLTADPEPARTAPLAAQVVESLDADPELGSELRQGEDGGRAPAPRMRERGSGALLWSSYRTGAPALPRVPEAGPGTPRVAPMSPTLC